MLESSSKWVHHFSSIFAFLSAVTFSQLLLKFNHHRYCQGALFKVQDTDKLFQSGDLDLRMNMISTLIHIFHFPQFLQPSPHGYELQNTTASERCPYLLSHVTACQKNLGGETKKARLQKSSFFFFWLLVFFFLCCFDRCHPTTVVSIWNRFQPWKLSFFNIWINPPRLPEF